MIYAIIAIWVLSLAIFLRAAFLAIGTAKKKFPNGETFLLDQKISFTLLILGLVGAFVVKQTLFIYLFATSLLCLFLFYLQPTPRTTKLVLKIYIVLNLIFVGLLLLRIL